MYKLASLVVLGCVLAATCVIVVAGCGARAVEQSSDHSEVDCNGFDYSTPDWQQPAGDGTQVGSISQARHVSGLEVIPPMGLGAPAAIFAKRGLATWFVFQGGKTGDVILVESKPQLSVREWSQYLRGAVGANGQPHTVGTASISTLVAGVKALQTVSPCLTGSTTNWRTADGRLEVLIDAHTMDAADALAIARHMSRVR